MQRIKNAKYDNLQKIEIDKKQLNIQIKRLNDDIDKFKTYQSYFKQKQSYLNDLKRVYKQKNMIQLKFIYNQFKEIQMKPLQFFQKNHFDSYDNQKQLKYYYKSESNFHNKSDGQCFNHLNSVTIKNKS